MAHTEVCVPKSEIKDEVDDNWWLVHIKQEQDVDDVDHAAMPSQATHWVYLWTCFVIWLLFFHVIIQ